MQQLTPFTYSNNKLGVQTSARGYSNFAMENGLCHESRTSRKVEGHEKPVNSGSTGYSRDVVKGRAYGSNVGVCRHCKHVPRSVGVIYC